MLKNLSYRSFISSIVACLALSVSSCSTLNRSQVTAPLNPTIESKLKADIAVDMSKKLAGVASSTTLFGFLDLSSPSKYADGVFASSSSFFSFGTGPDELKAAATYNAVVGKADVIVDPQYIVQKKSYLIYSTTTVWVSGYAGTIKKIE